jgi:hypothetical protein
VLYKPLAGNWHTALRGSLEASEIEGRSRQTRLEGTSPEQVTTGPATASQRRRALCARVPPAPQPAQNDYHRLVPVATWANVGACVPNHAGRSGRGIGPGPLTLPAQPSRQLAPTQDLGRPLFGHEAALVHLMRRTRQWALRDSNVEPHQRLQKTLGLRKAESCTCSEPRLGDDASSAISAPSSRRSKARASGVLALSSPFATASMTPRSSFAGLARSVVVHVASVARGLVERMDQSIA